MTPLTKDLTEIEAALLSTGALDPSKQLKTRTRHSDTDTEFDDIDDEPSSKTRSAATTINGPHRKTIRTSAKKDGIDSDFEFDI